MSPARGESPGECGSQGSTEPAAAERDDAASSPVDIAVAVVERNDCFVVGRREATGALAGKAEFPGGKIEPGESAAEAARRECREETGLDVEVLQPCSIHCQQYEHGTVRLHFFAAAPSADACGELPAPWRWAPRSELASLDFPAGNRDIVRQITRQARSGPDA